MCLLGNKCEVCGKPATVESCDVIEEQPHIDEHGNKWRQVRSGTLHHYCERHAYDAKIITTYITK